MGERVWRLGHVSDGSRNHIYNKLTDMHGQLNIKFCNAVNQCLTDFDSKQV